ncbi:hypothetical protein AO738_12710 [Pseudomonas citronellolis]|nr:hypothetical protein AO742_26330 [Pseudomonas citronellolis]KRW76527.1 hypothetical protein AO738_12710 [Pseudomonas citronellolis]
MLQFIGQIGRAVDALGEAWQLLGARGEHQRLYPVIAPVGVGYTEAAQRAEQQIGAAGVAAGFAAAGQDSQVGRALQVLVGQPARQQGSESGEDPCTDD